MNPVDPLPADPAVAPARLLLITDSPEAVLRLGSVIERASGAPQVFCTTTHAALETGLCGEAWDLVVCNLRLGLAGGINVLQLVEEQAPDAPVIAVSAVDSASALAGLQALGARVFDCLSWKNLDRLPFSIEYAMCCKTPRREHERVLVALGDGKQVE